LHLPLHRPQRAIRSVEIGPLLDTFLVCSVSTILIIRLQLWLTHYPQLGGGKLHIAHLLWGGGLMLVALILLLGFVGRSRRVPAAVIGGAGFGFFIDEVGKFVTSDNDYFYKPSAAIIYIVFICLYFAARWTRERRGFTDEEQVASALDLFTDATVRGFNEREKRRALRLLEDAEAHPLTEPLRELIERAPAGPELPPSRFARFAGGARRRYARWSRQRWFRRAVIGTMVLFATLQALEVLLVTVAGVSDLLGVGTLKLDFTVAQAGEAIADVVAAGLALFGLQRLRKGHTLAGYGWFDRALLVQLFVGQVFAYIDASFVATWGFLFCLALLVSLRFMIREEQRLQREGNGGRAPLGGPAAGAGGATPQPARASAP